MPSRTGTAHVVTTRRTYKDKVYCTHLLRRSYREDGKVKNETLGNLSHLPDALIDIIRRSLQGETFVPARDAGLLAPGSIIKMKCAIQIDDRTGGRRLTGYELGELKPRKAAANGKGPLEITLWTNRHSEMDLEEIHRVLKRHPGKTPVMLHFQNSAGKRATLEAGDNYQVKRGPELEGALERWIED